MKPTTIVVTICSALLVHSAPAQSGHWPPLLEQMTELVWIEDEFPAGANLTTNQGNHAITWLEDPAKSGHRAMLRKADGVGQHYFEDNQQPLTIGPEAAFIAWVKIDEKNPPTAIMLQFYSTRGWTHRACWGTQ